MKLKTNKKTIHKDFAKNYNADNYKTDELVIEVKEWKNKRSLSQNSLLWSIIGKMATAIKTTSNEVYFQMLKSYGVTADNPIGLEKAHPQYKQILSQVKYYIIRDGQNPKLDYVYMVFGSSTYDTKQMAHFIDGILSECEQMQLDVSYESGQLKSLKE
jgi:hypothetical protein